MAESYQPIISELERIAKERGYAFNTKSIVLNPEDEAQGYVTSTQYEIRGEQGKVSMIQGIAAKVDNLAELVIEVTRHTSEKVWPVEHMLPKLRFELQPITLAYHGEQDDVDMSIRADGSITTHSPVLMLAGSYQNAFNTLLDLLEGKHGAQ